MHFQTLPQHLSRRAFYNPYLVERAFGVLISSKASSSSSPRTSWFDEPPFTLLLAVASSCCLFSSQTVATLFVQRAEKGFLSNASWAATTTAAPAARTEPPTVMGDGEWSAQCYAKPECNGAWAHACILPCCGPRHDGT